MSWFHYGLIASERPCLQTAAIKSDRQPAYHHAGFLELFEPLQEDPTYSQSYSHTQNLPRASLKITQEASGAFLFGQCI